MHDKLRAPFPWFGGKSRVSHLVWERFGAVQNYVEPFFGSGAVLLGRPDWHTGMKETVNDRDSLLCNFWRSIAWDADLVAEHAYWPAIESDMHARGIYLLNRREEIERRIGDCEDEDSVTLRRRLEGDPFYRDPELAGWWVWGMGLWIGGGFATACGPWQSVDGISTKMGPLSGTKRTLPDNRPKGVWRCLPHLSSGGQGVHRMEDLEKLKAWFADLQYRLRRVRVCSGDWKRVLGESVTVNNGLTGLFLDPPYPQEGRDARCYAHETKVWNEVWPWAVQNGGNELLRIALCGYDGRPWAQELKDAGWVKVPWVAQGGYGGGMGSQGEANRHRERIWFSPNCRVPGEDGPLPSDVPGQLLLGAS